MPINNIPGVGPTNADIATAVAAPSAATIAAAVAAPSAATIAAAVAAPSSATIASAVAAAVPTTAGITSIVQANAGSPYAGTITHIGYATGNGSASYTFSNLSGYKYLKLVWAGVTCSANGAGFQIRINDDASTKYMAFIHKKRNDTATPSLEFGFNNKINLETILNDYLKSNGVLTIPNSNSGAVKQYTMLNSYNNTAADIIQDYNGAWLNTSAISSITLSVTSGTFNTAQAGGGFYLMGAN